MEGSKNNIKFNYLYRDGGNYKIYGSEVFANPKCIKINEIEKQIRAVLIDGEFFDPKRWGVKRLSFSEWDDDLDHFWNEFDSVQLTDGPQTMYETIAEFLKVIARQVH